MKMKFILFTALLMFIVSCNREDETSIHKRILGSWTLTSTTQFKNGTRRDVQIGKSTFEFTPNDLKISGDTFLDSSGNYSYNIAEENYFENNLSEPKSTLLKFNNNRYVVELGVSEGKDVLTLMNYTDGKIYLRLTR